MKNVTSWNNLALVWYLEKLPSELNLPLKLHCKLRNFLISYAIEKKYRDYLNMQQAACLKLIIHNLARKIDPVLKIAGFIYATKVVMAT